MSSVFDLSGLYYSLEQQPLYYEDKDPITTIDSPERLPRYFEVCFTCNYRLLSGSCPNCKAL